ncbi:MAG: tetratricopeptide repeat protein [Bdellovibrionaceae bacterium]|nr:tetratricopeptide repeat protein [Pseudobdellovibrionaceae bacterium]
MSEIQRRLDRLPQKDTEDGQARVAVATRAAGSSLRLSSLFSKRVILASAIVTSILVVGALTLKRWRATAPATPVAESSTSRLQASHMAALMAYRQNNAIGAREQLARLVEENPKNAVLHANLGVALVASGTLSEALEHLETALSLDAEQPKFWNNIGYVHMQLFNWDEAEKAFLRALEIDSAYAHPLFHLAQVSERRKKWADAIDYYKRFLELEGPQSPQQKTLAERMRILGSYARFAETSGGDHALAQ